MLTIFGVNHDRAPVALRERVVFAAQELKQALHSLVPAHQAVAIMSTCNRTEIYADTVDGDQFLDWTVQWHKLDTNAATALQDAHYLLSGDRAAEHIMRVASGLDSLVLGEPQILGQLKSAYAVAADAGTLNSELHRVFQQAFATAKKIRTETAIGRDSVSVAHAAVMMARQVFSKLSDKTALLIGAGETVRLVSQHLVQQGVNRMLIANRTLDRAQALIDEMDNDKVTCEALLLADLHEFLPRADIVISSTASQLPILGKGAVESAMRARRHRLMFMVDIAVPRDIEPEVDALDDVYLFTVDDLGQVIERNKRNRERAADDAKLLIEESVLRWRRDQRLSNQTDLIKQYRRQAEQWRDAELAQARQRLLAGDSPEKVLERLAQTLTNKIIHQPTVQISKAIGADQQDMIDMAQTLLGLGSDTEE